MMAVNYTSLPNSRPNSFNFSVSSASRSSRSQYSDYRSSSRQSGAGGMLQTSRRQDGHPICGSSRGPSVVINYGSSCPISDEPSPSYSNVGYYSRRNDKREGRKRKAADRITDAQPKLRYPSPSIDTTLLTLQESKGTCMKLPHVSTTKVSDSWLPIHRKLPMRPNTGGLQEVVRLIKPGAVSKNAGGAPAYSSPGSGCSISGDTIESILDSERSFTGGESVCSNLEQMVLVRSILALASDLDLDNLEASVLERCQALTEDFVSNLNAIVYCVPDGSSSTDGSGRASTQQTGPSSDGNSLSNASLKGKGKRTSDDGHSEKTFQDDHDKTSNKRRKDNLLKLRLSCPYRKRNPGVFNVREYYSCSMTFFPSIAAVR